MEVAYNNLSRRQRELRICIPLAPVQPAIVSPSEDLRHTPSGQWFPQFPLSPPFCLLLQGWLPSGNTGNWRPQDSVSFLTAGAARGWTLVSSIPGVLRGLKLPADEISLITLPLGFLLSRLTVSNQVFLGFPPHKNYPKPSSSFRLFLVTPNEDKWNWIARFISNSVIHA